MSDAHVSERFVGAIGRRELEGTVARHPNAVNGVVILRAW